MRKDEQDGRPAGSGCIVEVVMPGPTHPKALQSNEPRKNKRGNVIEVYYASHVPTFR